MLLVLCTVCAAELPPTGIMLGYYGNANYERLQYAVVSGIYRDLYFYGAFCPPQTGSYRITYDGTVDATNEQVNSHYYFMGVDSKSRVTQYFDLDETKCYYYRIAHSVNVGACWGEVSYQKLGEEPVRMNGNVSYVTYNNFCLYGGEYPDCMPKPTATFTTGTRFNDNEILMCVLIFAVL